MPAPLALRRIFARLILPFRTRIRSGPNQGCWWSIASGRYLSGTMESAKMGIVEHVLARGEAFWDVGAHHGYVALHASRCAGPDGVVHAFEPSPYNLTYLRKHLAWNARSNMHLHPLALGAEHGTAHLNESGSSRAFSLGTTGSVVEVESVPRLIGHHGLRPPDMLKLDVEGAEGDIVEAAVPHLAPSCRLLVAIHSMENYQRVKAALASAGFLVLDSAGTRQLRETEPGDWSWDPDILAYGRNAPEPGEVVTELLEQI